MPKRFAVLFICLAAWLSVDTAEGAEFHCASGDVACLLGAIRASNQNGQENTIHLEAGIYELTAAAADSDGVSGLPTIVGKVTIIGVGPDKVGADVLLDESTVIQRPENVPPGDPPFFRLFDVAATGSLELVGVTLKRGNPGPDATGGAIRSLGTLTLTNVVIRENSAERAGAIDLPDGGLTMTDSELRSNAAVSRIVVVGCLPRLWPIPCPPAGTAKPVTITRSSFGDRALIDSLFSIENDAPVTIRDSDFSGNDTTGGGGAIGVYGRGPVTIENTTIAGTFSNCFCDLSPAGITVSVFSEATVRNSTIVNNGIGIRTESGDGPTGRLLLQNSIVAGNNNNPARVTADCVNQAISLGHNLFGNPDNCGAVSTDLTGDPGVGALIDSGRPGGRYVPLQATSRAIDASDGNACGETDQRRVVRNIDGNGDGLRACDIGAVEYYPIVNNRVQLQSLRYAFVAPPLNGPVDPRAAAGEFRITAVFANTGPDICRVAFDAATLNAELFAATPLLLTPARELLGGRGSAISAAQAGAPTHLRSGASQTYQFTIGVQVRRAITFMVNVVGDATSGPCGQ